MKRDSDLGLVPFFVMATLGTTSSCAFDNLAKLGNKPSFLFDISAMKRFACNMLQGPFAMNSKSGSMWMQLTPEMRSCVQNSAA